jgi:hypothetical protein
MIDQKAAEWLSDRNAPPVGTVVTEGERNFLSGG